MNFTLTNYWWLLIWIFVGGGICAYFFPKRREYVLGELVERWEPLAAIIVIFPYIIWTGFRTNAFGDTGAYRNSFKNAPDTLSQLVSYVSDQDKDKGYWVIVAIFKSLISHSDIVFFLAIGAVQLGCLAWLYRKYSTSFWMSMFLFISSTDYIAWMHNGMRQFLAVTLLLLCVPLILKKKYVPLIIMILLISTIHMTALLMIPFVFIVQGRAWNNKTLLFILVVIVSMLFLDRFTSVLTVFMENTQYSAETTDLLQDDGVNVIRALFYSIPTIFSFVFRKRIDAADNQLMNVCVNMSITSMGFYIIGCFTSGIYIGRIPIFFSLYNYILYPWMIDEIFTKESAKLLKVILCIVYVVFFYYQMGITWNLL